MKKKTLRKLSGKQVELAHHKLISEVKSFQIRVQSACRALMINQALVSRPPVVPSSTAHSGRPRRQDTVTSSQVISEQRHSLSGLLDDKVALPCALMPWKQKTC